MHLIGDLTQKAFGSASILRHDATRRDDEASRKEIWKQIKKT